MRDDGFGAVQIHKQGGSKDEKCKRGGRLRVVFWFDKRGERVLPRAGLDLG